MRLRFLDLPVFPHPCLYTSDFNYLHVNWSYNDKYAHDKCLAGYKYQWSFPPIQCQGCPHLLLWPLEHGPNPDLAFAVVGSYTCLSDRCVLKKFPKSQHWPLLITPPRYAC